MSHAHFWTRGRLDPSLHVNRITRSSRIVAVHCSPTLVTAVQNGDQDNGSSEEGSGKEGSPGEEGRGKEAGSEEEEVIFPFALLSALALQRSRRRAPLEGARIAFGQPARVRHLADLPAAPHQPAKLCHPFGWPRYRVALSGTICYCGRRNRHAKEAGKLSAAPCWRLGLVPATTPPHTAPAHQSRRRSPDEPRRHPDPDPELLRCLQSR